MSHYCGCTTLVIIHRLFLVHVYTTLLSYIAYWQLQFIMLIILLMHLSLLWSYILCAFSLVKLNRFFISCIIAYYLLKLLYTSCHNTNCATGNFFVLCHFQWHLKTFSLQLIHLTRQYTSFNWPPQGYFSSSYIH